MMTRYENEIHDGMVDRYIHDLVGRFFKILPLKETNSDTLVQYIVSLQREMIGCASLLPSLSDDGRYLQLLSILQEFIDQNPDVAIVKSEVFRAIGIIHKMNATANDRGD